MGVCWGETLKVSVSLKLDKLTSRWPERPPRVGARAAGATGDARGGAVALLNASCGSERWRALECE